MDARGADAGARLQPTDALRYLKTLKDAGFLMFDAQLRSDTRSEIVEMDYLARRSDALVLHGLPQLLICEGRHSPRQPTK
jgi:hypothetical protein